jgi:hypothetical protein
LPLSKRKQQRLAACEFIILQRLAACEKENKTCRTGTTAKHPVTPGLAAICVVWWRFRSQARRESRPSAGIAILA